MFWLKIGAAVVLLAAIVGSYAVTYRAGVASERTAALTRSVEVLRERNKTDGEIRHMDDPSLCVKLGGVWDNGACK